MSLLLKYHWPGNIRELENLVERAIVLSENDVLSTKNFQNLDNNSCDSDNFENMFDGFSLKEAQAMLYTLTKSRICFSRSFHFICLNSYPGFLDTQSAILINLSGSSFVRSRWNPSCL